MSHAWQEMSGCSYFTSTSPFAVSFRVMACCFVQVLSCVAAPRAGAKFHRRPNSHFEDALGVEASTLREDIQVSEDTSRIGGVRNVCASS